jgi:uncharacterized protein YqhQ
MRNVFRYLRLVLFMAEQTILVGGQAIIEGVMMRVPGAYAIAVRNPRNEIVKKRWNYTSWSDTHTWLKTPVLRGAIALIESMKMGIQTLNESADIAFEEELAPETFWTKLQSFLGTVLALGIGLGLFFATPIIVSTKIFHLENTAFSFNVITGIIRIALFLLYLWAISLMKDVKRLFQYHGGEHMAVYTFESGKELTIEEARKFPTQHPRCGTSFIFIVLLASIFMFAIIDSIAMMFIQTPTIATRLLTHLPLMPLVAGVSYELLKLTSKYRRFAWVRALSAPGLWLQNITTSVPDDDQLQVALDSLKEAFGEKLNDFTGKTYVAEAID